MNSIADDPVVPILRDLFRRASPKRYLHTLGVLTTATVFAERFSVDRRAARIAAAAHDIARELPVAEALARAADRRIALTPAEYRTPQAVHGALAADELRHSWGIDEPDILEAVRHHTFGAPQLGDVGLVLFASDYLEPGRRHVDPASRLRMIGGDSLPAVICAVIDHSRARFARLEEPTERLYARLSRTEWQRD